jgi:hypothetical protein
MSTKEAKADFQIQDKVDKQKSETKSAPKKKTPVNRKQNKSQVAVKKKKVDLLIFTVGTEKLVSSPYNPDIKTKSKASPVVT